LDSTIYYQRRNDSPAGPDEPLPGRSDAGGQGVVVQGVARLDGGLVRRRGRRLPSAWTELQMLLPDGGQDSAGGDADPGANARDQSGVRRSPLNGEPPGAVAAVHSTRLSEPIFLAR